MTDRAPETHGKLPASTERLMQEVGAREARMMRRKKEGTPNVLRSVGLVGLIGWTVVVPMLAGIAIGLWIDHRWPSRFSWTLMLLFAGLGSGCFHAWSRIKREQEGR